MAKINEIHSKYKAFDLRRECETIVLSEQNTIIELNKEQLQQGFNAVDTKITPKYRSSIYAKQKFGMNSRAGFRTPDLKLTGSFYNNFKLLSYNITSIDYKTAKLQTKYGQIFGLNTSSRKLFIPTFAQLIRSKIYR